MSTDFPLTTMLNHSVCCCLWPFLSVYFSVAARVSLAILLPSWNATTSGSLPALPIIITLLSDISLICF